MRLIISILFTLLTNSIVFGQSFLFPKESKIYSDSFAVQLDVTPGLRFGKPSFVIESSFADRYYADLVTDSVLIVPYYLQYDKERMLIGRIDKATTPRYVTNFVKLIPMAKNDSLESAIIRVMENPSENNLLRLAEGYEKNDCYGNALYVYYKLYRLGFRNYWNAFTKRHLSKREVVDSVLR